MIRLRLAASGFTQIRFCFSPISELADSLYMLHSGQVEEPYRGWAERARQRTRGLDYDLLRAVVPHTGVLPDFPQGTAGVATTIDQQLKLLADWEPDLFRAEMQAVWRRTDLPPATEKLIASGSAGLRLLADVFRSYWEAALEPCWSRMRAVLEAEIAYRARQLTHGGLAELLADLHPQVELEQDCIRINKPRHSEHDLAGTGLLLNPCIFCTPGVLFGPGPFQEPCLVYRPRGVATIWEKADDPRPMADDPLGALLGRSRAAILRGTALPKSTTELARELGQAVATVSEHLSTLRRCGMITSWRAGRSVLHQRTSMTTSFIEAVNGHDRPDQVS
jgi:hypothetical protein